MQATYATSTSRAPKRGRLFGLAICFSLCGCATANHGTFVPNTYRGNYSEQGRQPLGSVMARSCQTRVLYIFPSGTGPSTAEALRQAMAQYEGTDYLADVSIDNETVWGFGYARDCIEVKATAY